MVASALGIEIESLDVEVEGDLDLRGTLGVAKDVADGFQNIRLALNVVAPSATEEQIESLKEKTLRYCVVFKTLESPPVVDVSWKGTHS